MQRKSLYGIPSRMPIPSKVTEELVPLMGGIHSDVPGIMLDTASSASMQNFVTLDGYIAPRSHLSSSYTNVFNQQGRCGFYAYEVAGGSSYPIASMATLVAKYAQDVGWSLLSFVSSHGIGSLLSAAHGVYDYAVVYSPTVDQENILFAARQSFDTLLAISPSQNVFSYCTGAPGAGSVAGYDNYLIAFNIKDPTVGQLPTRVKWSDRGDPYNWTTGLSGFEDLVAMRGSGTKVVPLDSRIILFSDWQMWYGIEAAYPAQFQFAPLEPSVGCPFPQTVIPTSDGLLFLDHDFHLRKMPKFSWTAPEIISDPVREIIQANIFQGDKQPNTTNLQRTWGLYDPHTYTYRLFIAKPNTANYLSLAVNTKRGTWSLEDYPNANNQLVGGGYIPFFNGSTGESALLAMGQTGQIYSYSSTTRMEVTQTPVTATWRSKPLGGDYPGQEKTMMEVRLDYKATSASSGTVTMSFDNGITFPGVGAPVVLQPTSVVSEAIFHVYGSGRYPMIQWQSEATGYQLHRCHAVYRVGGR